MVWILYCFMIFGDLMVQSLQNDLLPGKLRGRVTASGRVLPGCAYRLVYIIFPCHNINAIIVIYIFIVLLTALFFILYYIMSIFFSAL